MSRLRLSGLTASAALFATVLLGCENTYPPRPETWAKPPVVEHTPRTELPPATHEGAGPEGSLLASYAEREPRDADDFASWQLPFQAKTMIVELLIAAAKDDPERLKLLLTDNARWGLPDRRQTRARPIIHDDDPLGLEFLDAFRSATSRFGAKASFTCIPLQPGWQMFASSGAEPVWCTYASSDGLDILAARLIVEQGRVKTDYVGFFTERQSGASLVKDTGDSPPATPYLKQAVSLVPPELMPDGSNPVVEKPRPRPQPKPEPAPEPAQDAPIPVEANR